MYMGCSLHIYIEHRNLEIRKTRNDFSVQVRNLLLPLSLRFRHKEREAQSFYAGFFICPPPPISFDTCPRPPRASESQPSSPKAGLSSTHSFSKSPLASGAWRHSHSVAPVSHLGYCDISEWHVRFTHACVNTCVNVAHK